MGQQQGNRVYVTVRIDRSTLNEVEALAPFIGRSKSFLIAEAVKFGLPAMLATYKNFVKNYDKNLNAAKPVETA